jgi:hypothetical protein
MEKFKVITMTVFFCLMPIIVGSNLMGIQNSIKNQQPADLVSLTDKYDRIIATKSAEIKQLKEYIENQNDEYYEEWEAERQFVDNRCVCKEYSGVLDSASGQYIETINPKKLSKQEICK